MSSIGPLQSSSAPLHVSGLFATPPWHTRAPAWQTYWPVEQRVPVLVFMQSVVVPVGQHAWLTQVSVRLSSTTPVQSLSFPSHVSGLDPTLPLHPSVPLVDTTVPPLHSP